MEFLIAKVGIFVCLFDLRFGSGSPSNISAGPESCVKKSQVTPEEGFAVDLWMYGISIH